MDEVSNFCPAIAVPITVKIPEPITAPMPRAVRETGPSVFFSLRSGSSESEISLSIDLQQKSWLSDVRTTGAGSVGGCDKRSWSPVKPALRHERSAFSQLGFLLLPRTARQNAKCLLPSLPYRFAWPRASFLTLGFFDPR